MAQGRKLKCVHSEREREAMEVLEFGEQTLRFDFWPCACIILITTKRSKERKEWKKEGKEGRQGGQGRGKMEEEKNFGDIIEIKMKWSLTDQLWFL